MPIPEQYSDVWSMDFISGQLSSQGNNTIYIHIDKFTKFVCWSPVLRVRGHLVRLIVLNYSFQTTLLDYLAHQKWYCMIVIQGLLPNSRRSCGKF